jgi:hypothetical protein
VSFGIRPRNTILTGAGFELARANSGPLSTQRLRRLRPDWTLELSISRKGRLSIARSSVSTCWTRSGRRRKQGKTSWSRQNSQERVSMVSRPCIHRRRRKLGVFRAANHTNTPPTNLSHSGSDDWHDWSVMDGIIAVWPEMSFKIPHTPTLCDR